MSDALHIISIQHELAMATGIDLRLDPMLKQFMKVCLRRLGLAGVHVFLAQDQGGKAMLADDVSPASVGPYLSLPASDPMDCDVSRLLEGAGAPEGFASECIDGRFAYCFRLEEIGFVLLRRLATPIDTAILMSLKPIMARLATSCRAALEHEQLLYAIEARKKAEDAVVFQLYHDDLTQLPNRRNFMERLNQELALCRRQGRLGAVLFVDLDRFKAVNDTFGHSVGDELLSAVASLLSKTVRREDIVARLAGDEFAILLTGLGDKYDSVVSGARAVARKISRLFNKPLTAGEHRLQISPSIGIEVYSCADRSAEDILRHADTAMYKAKSSGRNAVAFYDQQMSLELEERLELEKELRDAVTDFRGFELYYQPQFNYARELIGAEALLRWNSAGRGPVSPACFVPVAEETGLILEIGDWVLRSACRQLRQIENAGLPSSFKRLSVNVSAMQLGHRRFLEKVRSAIKDSGVDPGHLGIELTEGTLIENINATGDKMHLLRRLGLTFSIDDFGTGYSSLSYLTRFPLETLKIDQSFVRDVHSIAGKQAIVETIMALGHSLGLSIIAEGVETEHELECLLTFECRQYQGFYFSRPLPFDALMDLVERQASPGAQVSAGRGSRNHGRH